MDRKKAWLSETSEGGRAPQRGAAPDSPIRRGEKKVGRVAPSAPHQAAPNAGRTEDPVRFKAKPAKFNHSSSQPDSHKPAGQIQSIHKPAGQSHRG